MKPFAVIAAVVFFAGFMVLERIFPLRNRTHGIVRRLATNLLLSAMAFTVGAMVVRPVAMKMILWSNDGGLGLLRILPLPSWGKLLGGLLLMDLTFYYWHRINHEVGILWRFHSVHHVDPDLDVSTSFRFHLGEILYSSAFRALQVIVIGVSIKTYVIYELVFQIATVFHHSNFRLPIQIERALNYVFVTPRMHGIHHSVVRNEVNSNYSVVFRLWDRLHNTLVLNVPQPSIDIGVAGYIKPVDNRIDRLLLMPFRRRKDNKPMTTEQPYSGSRFMAE